MGQNPNAKKDGYSQLEEANDTQPLLDQNQQNPLPEKLKQPVSNDSVTQPLLNNPKQTNLPVTSPAANSYLAKLNQLPTWIFEGIKQVVDKVVQVATTMKSSFAQGLLKGFTDVLSQCSRMFFSMVYSSELENFKGAIKLLSDPNIKINNSAFSGQRLYIQDYINHPRIPGLLDKASTENLNTLIKNHPELKQLPTVSDIKSESTIPKSDDDRPSQTKGMS